MALKRNPFATRSMRGSTFVSCSLVYIGDYAGQQKKFQTVVLAADLPGVQSPTEAQIVTAADAKATPLYNEWTAQIDAQKASVAPMAIQGGVVIP